MKIYKYYFSILITFVLVTVSTNILVAQSDIAGAVLDKSCEQYFNQYIKPGHVIIFESKDAKLDGKIMLVKNGKLHFVESKTTPRSSSKVSLKRLGTEGFVAMYDEKGKLVANLKITTKDKSKIITCQE